MKLAIFEYNGNMAEKKNVKLTSFHKHSKTTSTYGKILMEN